MAGKIKWIESKYGPNARFTNNQKTAYPEISRSGGTIRGNNGISANLQPGTQIPPTEVQVDAWNGAVINNNQ